MYIFQYWYKFPSLKHFSLEVDWIHTCGIQSDGSHRLERPAVLLEVPGGEEGDDGTTGTLLWWYVPERRTWGWLPHCVLIKQRAESQPSILCETRRATLLQRMSCSKCFVSSICPPQSFIPLSELPICLPSQSVLINSVFRRTRTQGGDHWRSPAIKQLSYFLFLSSSRIKI